MTALPVLGSTVGSIFQPLYEALAWTLAFFYALVPNFAVAIALLTVAVMVVTSPFTVKSTRSQLAMQKLAPELKKIQQKYKGDRVTLNEQMMKLYKEHGVNPASGCVPLLLQLPVFVVLYGVIRGLTNTVRKFGKTGPVVPQPRYISHNTRLYHDLIAANGHMSAFGLDLTKTPFSHEAHWYVAIPYVAIVVVAILLQYLQMRQLNSRNPAAAQANPQMQMMQRYMPLVFAVIYIRISAGVNIYFVVSSLCRIGIQEAIFRSGMLNKPPAGKRASLPGERRRGFMERLADAQQRAIEQQKARQASLQGPMEPDEDHDDRRPSTGSAPPGETRPKSGEPRAGKATGQAKRPPPGTSGAKRPSTRPTGDGKGSGPGTSNGDRRSSAASGQNGSGRRSPDATPNGKRSTNGPGAQPPPSGHSRSAKKRPRKAR